MGGRSVVGVTLYKGYRGLGRWEGLVSCYIGRGVGEVGVGLPLYKVCSKSLWRCGSPATGLGSKAQSNKSVSRPPVLYQRRL